MSMVWMLFIAFMYQGVFSVHGVHGVYGVILPLFIPFVLLVVHSIVYLYYWLFILPLFIPFILLVVHSKYGVCLKKVFNSSVKSLGDVIITLSSGSKFL